MLLYFSIFEELICGCLLTACAIISGVEVLTLIEIEEAGGEVY
jgi:hypothetical protein